MKGEMHIITTDGNVTKQTLKRVPALSELQNAVGGYIETVPYFYKWHGQDCVAFCNEEGKLLRLPFNEKATKLWKSHFKHEIDDILVGNIVILTGDEAFLTAI